MVASPHTSNWDFLYAMCAFWYMRVDLKYFIKDSYTRGPFGWFFKWTGALGVDRSKSNNNLVPYSIELLNSNEQLIVLVPAEGSRKRVEKWKTGFYHIAVGAKVPVCCGYLDYEKKIAGILDVFWPSGDFEKDMHHIQELYRPIKGKFPEKYNPEIY